MDEPTLALIGISMIAALAAISPIRIPLALIAAMVLVREGFETETVALVAALGGALGRAFISVEARRETSRMGVRTRKGDLAQLNQSLGAGSGYPTLTFLAAATPIIPTAFLFGVIGALRLPVRYALSGAVTGQFLILWMGVWALVTVTGWLTESSNEAYLFLGLCAIFMLVIRTLRAVDWDAWRTDRAVRMRAERWEGQFVQMLSSRQQPTSNQEIIDVDAVEVDEVPPAHDALDRPTKDKAE